MSAKRLVNNRSRGGKEGKECPLIGKLLFRLYGLSTRRSFRKLLRYTIMRVEGGGHFSRTIRRIFSVYHQIEIGMYTSGPCYSAGCFPRGTKIGRYSTVFERTVWAFPANHPMDRISTHAIFYNPKVGYASSEADIRRKGLLIGNDVFIGHNATIVPSVDKIGDGAVIGSGSVVTKDVPDFAIVAGNPAKLIRYRFSEQTQRRIKESRWWEKSIDELNLERFAPPVESENGGIVIADDIFRKAPLAGAPSGSFRPAIRTILRAILGRAGHKA
jgi:virginiamycin A acetyltransferase